MIGTFYKDTALISSAYAFNFDNRINMTRPWHQCFDGEKSGATDSAQISTTCAYAFHIRILRKTTMGSGPNMITGTRGNDMRTSFFRIRFGKQLLEIL